jgi:protein tyrosine phosphatase
VTQNPLENTTAGFWHMIWQEKVNHIVMITSPNEKFVYYWPKLRGDLVYFDDIRVSLKEICNDKVYIHRRLQVQRNGESRQVDFAHIKISCKVVRNCYLWTKGIMKMFMPSDLRGRSVYNFLSHTFEVARGYL